jgi:hypothetical protein
MCIYEKKKPGNKMLHPTLQILHWYAFVLQPGS